MEPNKNVISGLKQSQKFVQISVISGLKIRVILRTSAENVHRKYDFCTVK